MSSAPFFFWCNEKDTQRFEWQAKGRGEAATSQSAAAARSPDRVVLLADAERLEDLDHAGRVRAAIRGASDRHFQGRAIRAGISGDLTQQSHSRHRRSRGPGGRPISVFESGAILQYLGRKTGKYYPRDERARVAVDEWLFWQMGGLGPMAGQANHFRRYAPEQIAYAIDRYTNEVNRLLRRAQHAACEPRFPGRPLFNCRYGELRLGQARRAHGTKPFRFSAPSTLVRNHQGAAGGETRARYPR